VDFSDEDREYRAWKKSIMLLYGRLATHKYASLFLRPITDDQAPGYSSIVHRYASTVMSACVKRRGVLG